MIIIIGPTAAGKTVYSLNLAKELDGEIISADSMQVYRGMDIGTAKPSKAEQFEVKHHLIDIRNPDEAWTVSDFIREAKAASENILKNGKIPIMVGGTGLYLNAWLNGFSFPIAAGDLEVRSILESEPLEVLYQKLVKADPKAAEKIHQNDKKRIVRALEVYAITGKPISELQKKGDSFSKDNNIIGLDLPREKLYERINNRVDNMIKLGLVAEVQGLLKKGYSKDLQSMQALGYKEVIDYLEGKYSKEEMIEELKKRTRNFARRQMTWFRRFENVRWLNIS